MRKMFCLLVIAVMSVVAVNAQEGAMGVGANLNYSSISTEDDGINNLGLGLHFRYNFTDAWRLDAGFNTYFKNDDDVSNWNMFANANYLFPMNNVTIYPLAGIVYGSMKVKSSDIYGSYEYDDASLGIQFGGGIDVPVSSSLLFNAEAKYSTCKYGDYWNDWVNGGWVLSAGLVFSI